MPWRGKKDVERKNKKCAKYAPCRKLWLKTANKYLKKLGDDGQAVIRANVKAKKWLQDHGKYRRNADTRLRDLERRASSGDAEALQEYIRHCARTGNLPSKFLIHNWESDQEFPEASDLDISYYQEDDNEDDEGNWVIEVEGDIIKTEYTQESDVIEEIRNTLHVCMRCFFPSNIENKCCHCTTEDMRGLSYCNNCQQALCTTDPCVLCLRLGYEDFPNSINGRVIEWAVNMFGHVCGMCMTSLHHSENVDPYHALIAEPYDQSPPLRKDLVTFRCSSCGLFPEPLDDDPRTNPYRRNAKRKQRKQEKRKKRVKEKKISTRLRLERAKYPRIIIRKKDGPPELLQLVRKALKKDFHFANKKLFPSGIHKVLKLFTRLEQIEPHTVDEIFKKVKKEDPEEYQNIVEEMGGVCTAIGEALFNYIPQIQRYIPYTDIDVIFKDGSFNIDFNSLKVEEMPDGTVHYAEGSRLTIFDLKDPTYIDRKNYTIGWTRHAIEQVTARLGWEDLPYTLSQQAFDVFRTPAATREILGHEEAISLWQNIPQQQQVEHNPIFRFLIDLIGEDTFDKYKNRKGHWFVRLGYFPVRRYKNFLIAITFLPPGYKATPEDKAIMRANLSTQEKFRLGKAVAKFTLPDYVGDPKVVNDMRYVHNQLGVPQILFFEGDENEEESKRYNPKKRSPVISIPDPEEVEYLGIFLTPQSKEKLKQVIPPKFKQKSGDHLTILFDPDEEDLERFLPYVGKRIVLTVTHEVDNDRVQAIRIKDIETEQGIPHITLSWDEGASPAESNELIETETGRPIQPWLKLQGIFDVYPRSLEDNPYRRNSDERRRQLERKLHSGDTTVWEELKALYARQGVEIQSCECKEPCSWHVNFGVGIMCMGCGGEGGEYGYDEYGYNLPPVWFACYACNQTGKATGAGECPTLIIPWENSAQLQDGRMVCMRCAPKDTKGHKQYGYEYHHYEDIDYEIPPISPRCMCRLCFPNELERLAEIHHWDEEERLKQEMTDFYAEQEIEPPTDVNVDIDDDEDAVPF